MKGSPSRLIPGLRAAVVAVGLTIFLIALFLDRFGLGQPGSFGLGQLLLALFGGLVALAGLLGGRIVELHRAAALLLLNTLLLLAFVELAAIVVSRLVVPSPRRTLFSRHMRQPYYANVDWSEAYWREAVNAETYRYEPYVGWRHAPFEGTTIRVDERGLRRTPGSECSEGSFKLFTFGGSSMWGWGSPDWGTIAAYLRSGLQERLDRPVCVENFGEDAWVSTQELIGLMAQLQRGSVPDAVVFYDGVNEVFAAAETGRPGAHLELRRIAARFETREHPLVLWLGGLRTVALTRRLLPTADGRGDGVGRPGGEAPPTAELAAAVVKNYLENVRMAQALAASHGFRSLFFWQPHLAIAGKPLTEDEAAMRSRLDPSLVRLSREAYAAVAREARVREGLWYIADVFDTAEEQIWIDEKGHITPLGNELVAQRILALMWATAPPDRPPS